MDDVSENELLTRRRRIDPRLRDAGWTIVDFDGAHPLADCDRCAMREYPTANGPADYALIAGGKIIGIVEAKRLVVGPQNVLTQAERYSEGASDSGLAFGRFFVPFLYSSNGEQIWHHDIRQPLNRSRVIERFHTPDALIEQLERDQTRACQLLLSTANDRPKLRDYQREANTEVEKAIAACKRRMMLAMATGTGKTFTIVNQVYRLMKSGVGKRILFLVDRRALAAQAARTFASFEAEPGQKFNQIYEVYSQRFSQVGDDDDASFDFQALPEAYLLNPHGGLAFVYVCTIQRMAINLFGRDAIMQLNEHEEEGVDSDAPSDGLKMPIHAFDVVIADECHRGYSAREASLFRSTLDHFDAIKIGLTATPAQHTLAYFNEIVYQYEYERAVRERYLVDYDIMDIESNVRMSGVVVEEGQEVGWVDQVTGAKTTDLLEDEIKFEASDVESKVTSPDSNRRILLEIKRYAEEHEAKYGRFPKTLIFADNDMPHVSHANQLVDLARDIFGRGDSFVQKITGSKDVDRPLRRIKEFRNRPEPGMVVTVDMLSTGVDIPDLECIVLLRQVRSRILFEQMIGRGTRKGEKYPDKSHFTVFDCFGGSVLAAFAGKTGISASLPLKETRPVSEVIEDIWNNKNRQYNTSVLVKRLQRVEKEMSGEARADFASYIEDGDVGKFGTDLPRLLQSEFTATMKLLRDKAFQELLVGYKRRPRTFAIAYESQDTVSSEWRARGADGKEYKPEDYLVAFSAFVKENADRIDAIRILLDKPAGWNYEALKELRDQLEHAPERFTRQNLLKAHELRYDKALIDVISMVKHAARQESPLFSVPERVDRAVTTATAGLALSDDQQKWMRLIREHMVISDTLALDPEEFDQALIFVNAGGWGRANKVFDFTLEPLLHKLNEAIAA